uniref:Uncharacterized protein n=1 Tax=Glossina austeni TaxID=7395 RepID=A0A1A9UFJ5_GLOAU
MGSETTITNSSTGTALAAHDVKVYSFFGLDLSFEEENDANIPKALPRLEDCPSCSNQESTSTCQRATMLLLSSSKLSSRGGVVVRALSSNYLQISNKLQEASPEEQSAYNVGVASAREILQRHPYLRVAIGEEEPKLTAHQRRYTCGNILQTG